jgi:hypothetical protein
MVRQDTYLPKRPSWTVLLGLGVFVALLCAIAAWGSSKLTDRKLNALERIVASLQAEKETLNTLWVAGAVPGNLLTAEDGHIREQASDARDEASSLSRNSP